MDYRRYYEDNIEKYNDTERNYLKQIFDFLESKKLTDEFKSRSETKIIEILKDLNGLNPDDKYYYNARREINQRIYGLFTNLQNAPENDNNLIDTEKVENDIRKFDADCMKLERQLNFIQSKLVLSDDIDLTLNDMIKDIDTEFDMLRKEAQQIGNDIDELRKLHSNAEFSMNYNEINAIISEFKTRIKNIKIMQIENYNARVEATNAKISELKGMKNIDESIASMINELSILATVSNKISWNSKKSLNEINYDKLLEINKKIAEINEKLGNNIKKDSSLEEDIKHIENEIERINYQFQLGQIDNINNDIDIITTNINNFAIKLANNKDSLSEEEYNEYMRRVTDAQQNLYELSEKLKNTSANEKSDYDKLNDRLTRVNLEIKSINNIIISVNGMINGQALQTINEQLNHLKTMLDEIKNDIKASYENSKLDNNQYENLINKWQENFDLLNDVKNKLKNPEIIKEYDAFAFLNGEIDGLVAAIDTLEALVESMEKPIKDKNVRKQIDNEIDRLEKEIRTIRKYLDEHSDDDKEKYNESIKRLDEQQERLEQISKKYRKKCPLLVKGVKSAKEFYKKHKKLALIIAGLAAIALVHATLGPVIIPAIMHGNLMVMHSVPALRGAIGAINKVLGSAIHAQVINNIWTLANGVTIAPYCASSSLLKGLAISGMGSAAIVAPLVVGIKELINKMNTHELKQKMTKAIEEGKAKTKKITSNVKEKTKESANKIKEKVKDTTNKGKTKNKRTREFLEEIKELFKQYQKSNLSFDEFCEQNNISEEDKIMLGAIDKKVREK